MDTYLAQLPDALQEHTRQYLQPFIAQLKVADLQPSECKDFAATIAQVFCCSQFIAETAARYPEVLTGLIRSKELFSADIRAQYMATLFAIKPNNEVELMRGLRKFRRRAMCRIAWRDLAGWAELEETLADLTALAESCIRFSLDFIYQQACVKYGTPCLSDGTPQQLVVLGMGKLGAWELNFSSDIDLIFAYAEEGVLADRRQTSYGEFFTRLCRSLVKTLDAVTEDGFVFRTDIRLRPFGDSGPVVMSFDGMENYYQTQAREWERYAMIKVRQVAGDFNSGPKLLAMLQPFVYRRYLDYGAFSELRSLKFKITQELQRKDKLENIKLGPGGIREIEFIAQAFQLIRGGHEKKLQQQQILCILSVLSELQLLSRQDAEQLVKSYCFLRRTENHLQEYQDKQTHELPVDERGQVTLAVSMGYKTWVEFKAQLDAVRKAVQGVFNAIFSITASQQESQECQILWVGKADFEVLSGYLEDLGYLQPEDDIKIIEGFRSSQAVKRLTAKGAAVLDQLMPQLLKIIPDVKNPDVTLKRILTLFEAVVGRNVYLSLLSENPGALSQLVKLSSASPWISDYLARYPALFDEFLDARSLYEPLHKRALEDSLQQQLLNADTQDAEQLMYMLRKFKHINVLRVAAADIMGVIPVLVVSDYLTWIAEVLLAEVVNISWRQLVEKHGVPPGADKQGQGFGLLGLGKLGGIELGYGSDLDMVFIYDCDDANVLTSGAKPISCVQFYGRLGQKIMTLLNTRLLSGILYEVDMRLRPSGNSGLLVNQIDAYEAYLMNDAWTWEHQALIRGRFIAGDPAIKAKFAAIRRKVLMRPRQKGRLQQQVREMREKMRANMPPVEPGQFDLKQGKGGIADIEFIVQFLVLNHAAEHGKLLDYTDNVGLLNELQALGCINEADREELQTAYGSYRDLGHRETLQGHLAIVAQQEIAHLQANVERLWCEYIEKNK